VQSYMKTDKTVLDVIYKYTQRSEVGIRKYGTTLEENNHDDFFKHLQEELMDATLYLQKLMSLNIELTKLVNETPNDAELGQKIRRLVR